MVMFSIFVGGGGGLIWESWLHPTLCVFFLPRGVTICFLIVGLLLTFAALSYLLGTALQMVCNDVSPPNYVMFREVTDKPSLWGGRTLVGAITASTIGFPINVSLVSVLRYNSEGKMHGNILHNLIHHFILFQICSYVIIKTLSIFVEVLFSGLRLPVI